MAALAGEVVGDVGPAVGTLERGVHVGVRHPLLGGDAVDGTESPSPTTRNGGLDETVAAIASPFPGSGCIAVLALLSPMHASASSADGIPKWVRRPTLTLSWHTRERARTTSDEPGSRVRGARTPISGRPTAR